MNDSERKRPVRDALPLVLIVIGLLLVAGVLAWLNFRSGQNNTSQGQSQASGSADASTPFPDIKRVSLDEAKSAFDSQSAVFVDVRAAETYNQSHIPGAINIPLAQIENRAGELDPNQWIITYCT
jgi:3-mercaptopyruvate sulfurtransferase SseA